MVDHINCLSPLEMEAGEPEVQGHPWLHNQLVDSLEYMRLTSKNKT